jgi:homoserine kinase
MALSLYNVFSVTELLPMGEFRSEVLGEGARELTDVASNLVVQSYNTACETWGAKGRGFCLSSHNVIPLCRGLGSSAGAVVAGVLIADSLCGAGASEAELLRLMTTIEGHPDNVAPCYLGGMTVSAWDGRELRYVRFPSLPDDMHVVVAVPDVRVKTKDARNALPDRVEFGDAVFNLGRAALLTAAWATGRWDLLSWGMDDRLHQQYRARLFPGGEVIMDRVRRIPGCLGVAISGSGPSVIALVRGKPRRVAEAMCATFSEHGVDSLFFVLEGNADGARVETPIRRLVPA